MQYIAIDYASEKLFDQYVNLNFIQKIYDADENRMKSENHYTYDTKTEKADSLAGCPASGLCAGGKKAGRDSRHKTPSITSAGAG